MQFLLSVFQTIWFIFIVLLVFNLIIVVHEWGHFLAARWRGLKVEKFQVWFGKPIWKKKINGVQYGLGSIPAGGFVALPQMAPMAMLEGGSEDSEEKLPPISPLDKIIVAFAGPLFSFGLAVVFAFFVWGIGYPVSKAANSTTIGVVAHGGPADKAGLKPGDVVKRVDGKEVTNFNGMVDSVQWGVITSQGSEIAFDIVRDGQEMTISIPVKTVDKRPWYKRLFERPPFRQVGVGPEALPIIAKKPMEFSPAEYAGLKEGDVVTHLNGQKLHSFDQIIDYMDRHQADELTLTVVRAGETQELVVNPRLPENLGDFTLEQIGGPKLGFGPLEDKYRAEGDRQLVAQHQTPQDQIVRTLRTMFGTLRAVFSPKVEVSAGHLSGGLGIMHLYFRLLESPEGWKLVLWFSVLLNINLAILNMLPIPVLDGGHITMAIIEGFLKVPINLRVLEYVNAGCALLLIGFMLFVTGFDAGDIFSRFGGGGELEIWSFKQLDSG